MVAFCMVLVNAGLEAVVAAGLIAVGAQRENSLSILK